MRITCPSCDRAIPAEDVNLDTGLARCVKCDEVFDARSQVGDGHSTKPTEPVPMPRNITVDENPQRVEIIRRWFTPTIIALLVFCTFWDGFLVVWYVIAFTQNSPLMMKIFPLLHLAAGVFLTYIAIAGVVNRTIISVNYDRLEVRHAPLLWPGSVRYDAADVLQVFVKRTSYQVNNQYRYKVMIETPDGAKKKLLGGLTDPSQGQFIEQQIERFLAIEDRRVHDEV